MGAFFSVPVMERASKPLIRRRHGHGEGFRIFNGMGTHPNNPQPACRLLSIGGNGVVYAGSFGHGIFRTVDRGATWARVGGGVTDPFILSLASTKDGAVYAGTFRGGVFRSRDDGNSWQSVNAGSNGLKSKPYWRWITNCLPVLAMACIVLHGSEDRWTPVTSGLDDILVHALARSADGTLFAGTSGKGHLSV